MPVRETKAALRARVREALAWLERHAVAKIRDEMAPRYGIRAGKAFGVSVANLHVLARRLGRSHALAGALWDTGWYEARMLATFVDEPERVTPAQMDRWCRDFDNWGICDTACFHLFDRTPHAFRKVEQWAPREEEFVRRGAFALLASLALHDREAPDDAFARLLPLVEKGARDGRNFVKKGVSWALRSIGRRRPSLQGEALALAKTLASSDGAAERWVGKDALRDLSRTRAAPKPRARAGRSPARRPAARSRSSRGRS
jgi:3-methyladenine DNA glycosylase AlkD